MVAGCHTMMPAAVIYGLPQSAGVAAPMHRPCNDTVVQSLMLGLFLHSQQGLDCSDQALNVWPRLGVCIEQRLDQLTHLWPPCVLIWPRHLVSLMSWCSDVYGTTRDPRGSHWHTCALMMASARLPPRSLSAFSNGDSPYIMKYRVHPSDQMSTFSSIVHCDGTSNSSGARYAAVHWAWLGV